MGALINITVKLVFLACVVLQVILWPSILTIVFSSALALEALVSYCLSTREEVKRCVFSPGYFLLREKVSKGSYVLSTLIGLYMTVLFMKFTVHETGIQTHMTTWIHESRSLNYSFTDTNNNPLPDVDVTSDISKKMRDNTFVWPKTWTDSAVRLNGTIPSAGPKKGNLRCYPPPSSTSGTSSNDNGGG